MLIQELRRKLVPLGLIIFSSLLGLRLINEYLKFNDRTKYEFESSSRLLKNGSKINVSHPQDFDISTTGKNTIIFISDSFGEGRKCGNSNNIAGCLSKLNPDKKVINLSFGGTTPAYYLKQIKNWWNSDMVTYEIRRDAGESLEFSPHASTSQSLRDEVSQRPPSITKVCHRSSNKADHTDARSCIVAGLEPNTRYRFLLRLITPRSQSLFRPCPDPQNQKNTEKT